MCGFPGAYFCIKAFSETDLTEDLKKFDVPTLILHGDDDQIVPIAASALLSSSCEQHPGCQRPTVSSSTGARNPVVRNCEPCFAPMSFKYGS